MDKYAVSCKCASGVVESTGMEKLGDGSIKCGQCGRIHKLDKLVLKDELRIQDKPLKSAR